MNKIDRKYADMGARIKSFMKSRGLTTIESAPQIGVTKEHFSRILSGNYPPSVEMLLWLDSSGADVKWVLTGAAASSSSDCSAAPALLALAESLVSLLRLCGSRPADSSLQTMAAMVAENAKHSLDGLMEKENGGRFPV